MSSKRKPAVVAPLELSPEEFRAITGFDKPQPPETSLDAQQAKTAERRRKRRSLQDKMREQLVGAGIEPWHDDDLWVQLPNLPRTPKSGAIQKTRPDFSWPEKKVALYIHGGTFIGGGHSRGAAVSKDMRQSNELQLMGWLVLVVDTIHVRKEHEALRWVKRALEIRATGSH